MNKVSLFAGAILLLVGCSDVPDVTQPSLVGHAKAPAALIDGADGGNPHFFFLPPIAERRSYDGALDKSLSPVVEICEWEADGCVLPLVSRLNAKLEGEHYGANWHTKGLALDVNRAYRLRVLVAGTELGSAELDVIRNGSEKIANHAVPVVAGSTLPVKFRIEQGAVWVIGAAGGSISAVGGQVQLEIPAGAVSSDVGITLQPTDVAPPSGGFVVAGAIYEIGPHGLIFDEPVRLTIAYDEANLPPDREEHELKLLHNVDGKWEVASGSSVDPEANTVSGLVTSFSPFASGGGAVITFSGTGRARIDGTMGTFEWANADCRNYSAKLPGGGTTPATLCVMNDATNLSMAIKVTQQTDPFPSAFFSFDNLDDGPSEGDDIITAGMGVFVDMFAKSDPLCAPAYCAERDVDYGGSSDGKAMLKVASGVTTFEMRHPLKSGDTGHDFSLKAGDIAGFLSGVFLHGSSSTADSDFPTPPDHGHIKVAAPLPATTTSLSTNATVALVGAPLQLTATVSPAPVVSPSSVVEFFDGETSLGTATTNASGVATLSVSSLGLSIHSLEAAFHGTKTLAASSSPIVTQHMIQKFDDLASFNAALGGAAKQTENFQSYTHGTPISSIFGGALILASSFARLEVWAPFGAANKVLFGHETPNSMRLAGNGRYYFQFNAVRNAFAFDITAQDPQSSPAEVTVVLTPTISKTFLESNSGSELTPNFFGVICTRPITGGGILEGIETGKTVNEEIALDNFVIASVPF